MKMNDNSWKSIRKSYWNLTIWVIFTIMVYPISVCAESEMWRGLPQNETQFPLSISEVQSQVSGDDDRYAIKDIEDEGLREKQSNDDLVRIADPLQPWNRIWHHFNDRLYFWLLKPMAQGYSFVVPEDVRKTFGNFYTNATAPVRIFNSLFQLKFKQFVTESERFFINTTVGFLGLRDCARECFGLEPHDEDFGQTLGHYGLGHGIYFVWPLLGPSSIRDTVGKGADSILSFTGIFGPVDLEIPVWAVLKTHELVNETSFRIGRYEALKKDALDPYTAMRDGYLQRRKKAMQE